MSLDVWLYEIIKPACECCGREAETKCVFGANITHNLGKMANEAGIYYALWRPEERGWMKASDIAPVIEQGLAKLEADPDFFKTFDPPNKWGSYDGFVPWVRRYLEACKQWPEATIGVSR